ncbi:MAG: hypothetical protein Q8N58_01310, partial [bacterium]|nr:hypothetical protein [bacterium]
FSKVKVEIWPKKNNFSLKQTITIDLKSESVDFDNNIIKGKLLDNEQSLSQEFSASGKMIKEEKAKGVITVYNAYSTSSRTLIPSRFVSSEGKLFWSTEKTTLPGASYEKGKLVPGEKNIEVEAAESGEEYNIDPTTFALPALAGTGLYTKIYAKSFSPMSGGFKGEIAQIIQSDLDRAQAVLTEKLKQASLEFFKTKTSDNLVLLDEAVSHNISDVNSSQKVGAGAESFNLEAKIKSRVIVFEKLDIESLVRNRINLDIGKDQKIQEENLEINYFLKEINPDLGKLVLDLEIKAVVYQTIDLNELKKALLGRSINEAKLFLNNLSGLDRVELKSWFFLRRIPEDANRLELKFNLD